VVGGGLGAWNDLREEAGVGALVWLVEDTRASVVGGNVSGYASPERITDV
jgi:hypothetical protein